MHEDTILPTQPASLSLENQPCGMLQAPQSLSVTSLPQLLPQALDPLGMPSTGPPWDSPDRNTFIPTPYDINYGGPSSIAPTQRRTQGSRYLATRLAKRKNAEDLSNSGRAPKCQRGPGCRKGPIGVPASHLNTIPTMEPLKGPGKKTNNSCLNCLWNHKGVRIRHSRKRVMQSNWLLVL
jgi:hypothetical protein